MTSRGTAWPADSTPATREGWVGTGIGSTVGIVAGDALAIWSAALVAVFRLRLVASGAGWL